MFHYSNPYALTLTHTIIHRCIYNSTNVYRGNIPYSGCLPATDRIENLYIQPVWITNSTFINRSAALLLNGTGNLQIHDR